MEYLTAKEAAAALEISLPTLYSYVSRGLIRSEVADTGRRTRRYRREDVDKLRQRKAQRRNPELLVEDALHWGTPLLDSTITLIAEGDFFYRGHNALTLAGRYPVEAVAGLIWHDDLQTDIPELREFSPGPVVRSAWAGLRHLSPVEQFQALLPLAAADDLSAYNLQQDAVQKTGGRILRLLAGIAAGNFDLPDGIAAGIQQNWAPAAPAATGLINTALILCADHELNVSSFTARCVASAGATPYQVVMAGLAALQGVKHGRVTERVESFLEEVGTPANAPAAIGYSGQLLD
jgi:citrate synthase